MVSPEITSVAVPVEPIANQLIDRLELALRGQTLGVVPHAVTRLVVRDSSGFAPRRGR